ncbi:uncharacterized protein (TIGR02217 family) [Rhodoligotrophos appendicifer]|uniref:DUF2460 domain-containing protein n=1 Tax=Rhodoligotrophos appendicifer TaxID=987056 RepID=UPI0011859AE0|nr:DUF2460 domain-containing protein [Rhodoligotrophos appendicifer]
MFHEVRFPTAISFGASGGPERRTDVVVLGSGAEERNARWAHSRRRYNAGYGVKSLDDLQAVIAFFETRNGRLHGFRYKDHTDFASKAPGAGVTATDQSLGTGTGSQTSFPLVKRYNSGGIHYVRVIAKPVAGTVRVAVGGVEQVAGMHFTVDPTTGLVTFSVAPAAAAALTAGFEFDTPVRFDTDRLEINLTAFQAGEIPAIPLVEIRI